MAFTKVLDRGLDAGHVGIRTAGSIVGVGFTMLNFVGAGNTFAINGQTVDISIAGGGGAGDAISKDNFVVTANTQSIFTLTTEYALGLIDVYVNGIKLPEGDYTEQPPLQVTLVQAAVKGDTVEFVGFREKITNSVINTQVQQLHVSGIRTFDTLHVNTKRTGVLGGGESTASTSGFASKVISIASVATVDAIATIAPYAGDDLTFVKYQDVKVNDNIDLTISSGDFVVDVYDLAI